MVDLMANGTHYSGATSGAICNETVFTWPLQCPVKGSSELLTRCLCVWSTCAEFYSNIEKIYMLFRKAGRTLGNILLWEGQALSSFYVFHGHFKLLRSYYSSNILSDTVPFVLIISKYSILIPQGLFASSNHRSTISR